MRVPFVSVLESVLTFLNAFINSIIFQGRRILKAIPLPAEAWLLLAYTLFALLFVFTVPPFETEYEMTLQSRLELNSESDYDLITPDFYRQLVNQLEFPTKIQNRFANLYTSQYQSNLNLWIPDRTAVNNSSLFTLRIVNVIISLLTIILIYLSGRLAEPDRPLGLLAALMLAFMPPYLYVSATAGPLPILILLTSLLIYLTIRLIKQTNRLNLLFLILSYLFYVSILNVEWIAGLSIILVLATLLKQNKMILELILAMSFIGLVIIFFSLTRGLPFVLGFNAGFVWAAMGIANIDLPLSLTLIMTVFAVFGFIVFIFTTFQLWLIRGYRNYLQQFIIYSFIFLTLMLILLQAFLTSARLDLLLYIALPVSILLISIGLLEIIWWLWALINPPDSFNTEGTSLVDRTSLKQGIFFIAMLLMLFNFNLLFYLPTQYPQVKTVTQLPDNASLVDAHNAELDLINLAYLNHMDKIYPGDLISVDVFWQAAQSIPTSYFMEVLLMGEHGQVLNRLETFPALGGFLTTLANPQEIYQEQFRLSLPRLDTLIGQSVELRLLWRDTQTNLVYDQWIFPLGQVSQPSPNILNQLFPTGAEPMITVTPD